MLQQLLFRVCFKRWSWLLVGFLVIYIYCVALYFLYSKQERVEQYVGGDKGPHSVHDHGVVVILSGRELPGDFSSWSDVMNFRRKRYERAQARSPGVQGPGEGGVKVILTSEEQKEANVLFDKETFNVIASNKMAMDRRVPDLRHPALVQFPITHVLTFCIFNFFILLIIFYSELKYVLQFWEIATFSYKLSSTSVNSDNLHITTIVLNVQL